jgi:N-formylglutamate amidohydrolase
MMELNCGVYMNELTGAKLPEFSAVAAVVQDTVRELARASSARMAAQQRLAASVPKVARS